MQTRSSPSRSTLHRLAEQASIPNYTNLSKKVLFDCLKEQFDYERLQRAEQRRFKSKRSFIEVDNNNKNTNHNHNHTNHNHNKGENNINHNNDHDNNNNSGVNSVINKPNKKLRPSRKTKSDDIDPITRTTLGKNVFTFIRPNGSCARFNVESLIDYMLATGDFTDPASRLPFSDEDLQMIDAIALKAKLSKQSVVNAKKNNIQLYADKKFKRDALQGLERCAGEVVSEMLALVEDSDPEEAQMKLLMTEFPAFADLFNQIKYADPQFATQCNRSWLLYLKGPPNHPTKDPYGLLKIILHFLKCCDTSYCEDMLNGLIGGYSPSSPSTTTSSSSSSSSSTSTSTPLSSTTSSFNSTTSPPGVLNDILDYGDLPILEDVDHYLLPRNNHEGNDIIDDEDDDEDEVEDFHELIASHIPSV